MAWACRALDNAPNSAPQCSERVVKACCDYSSYNRQLLLWVMVMESRKTSMVAAIHHSVCSPGADQGKWLYLIHLTELLSTEEEKPIYNPSFFLKYPWQTNSKGVIASQLDWDFRGPAETVDLPVAKVMVLEKWTRLHWSIRHYVGSLLSILCPPSPIPFLFWLLHWQRRTPFSCICAESSTMRLPNSPLTNTTESNKWRINSSKTNPDPSYSNVFQWKFDT